jgi:hypothetical protein
VDPLPAEMAGLDLGTAGEPVGEDGGIDGALTPDGGALAPDPDQPGLGLTLRDSDAEHYRYR